MPFSIIGKSKDSFRKGKVATLSANSSIRSTASHTLPRDFESPSSSTLTSPELKKSKGRWSKIAGWLSSDSSSSVGHGGRSVFGARAHADANGAGDPNSPLSDTYISSPIIDDTICLQKERGGSQMSIESNFSSHTTTATPSAASTDLGAELSYTTNGASPPPAEPTQMHFSADSHNNKAALALHEPITDDDDQNLGTGVLLSPTTRKSLGAISKMYNGDAAESNHLHRNVEYIDDARSGSEDANSNGYDVDAEGVRVRRIKLLTNQNVGFESLPVQFVNKATKAGFVFNVLVIGETGIGKSTLINSLFNYDFKLPPGDYQFDSVVLDQHTYHLEEGSVKLQLTIIETKGYGDQINMADSCKGIAEYIDKQYEAYFQEECQIARRLSDYKDTRVHVCLFLLAPTGSNVRALDLECMKLLGNKVNIIPVIARGDSLTKKELDSFKRRIVEELRAHDINIYKFPEDDPQVAEQNRKMNLDVPFAVVGSSDVHDVAGHKTRARVYPWGTVDIENEHHCDFTRFREALLRVNMDHLMQTTNLLHYEMYRDRRMQELGYDQKENVNFIDTIAQLRHRNELLYRQKEEETRATFVAKVRAKEAELKERERESYFGWGRTVATDINSYAPSVKNLTATVEANSRCRWSSSPVVVDDTNICATTSNKLCYGDNGAPLICQAASNNRWQVVGINSVAFGCTSSSNIPASFTKVVSYYDWIREVAFE